jgi:D-glycero-D-manno-heptose 1,7-bisphosphate phosphatase
MTTMDASLTQWVQIAARPAANSRALFLDRDGTIIENIAYLSDPDAVTVIPGAIDSIRAFRAAGFAVVVVTNQSGVARGLISPEQYRAVDAALIEQLGPGCVHASYACPFHPDGRGPYAVNHLWRKPRGGMIRAAAEDLDLDLAGSVMVGDSLADILAAADAGVGLAVHVLTGHGANERPAVEQWAANGKGDDMPVVRCIASIAELAPDQIAR